MAGEWRERPLGELAEIYDGPHATPTKTQSGPIFLGISNLAQGRLNLTEVEHLSEEDYARWTRRVEPQPSDVVFSYETRLGEVARVPPGLRCCLGRRMGLLRARHGEVDERFLLYAYLGPQFQETLRTRTIHGSTVDRIPLIDMPSFTMVVPNDRNEQRAIAHILGTLDDKIELNRRMNETLEAIARALFKSWFVDFDPVRAKAEGRDPGLPKALAGLFPPRLMVSELGEIPSGWQVTALKNLTTKIGSGATPLGGSTVYLEEGVALIRSQNVYDHEFRWNGLVRLSSRSAADLQGVEVKPGDILLNITGDSILRTCVVDPEVLPARVNQHVAIIRAAPAIPSHYLHLQLVQPSVKSFLAGLDAGATRKAVTKAQLESLTLIQPPRSILEAFEEATKRLFLRIDCNRSESRTLAGLRETLLPKLISGELPIKSAEKLVARYD